jgi:hypothetical protein
MIVFFMIGRLPWQGLHSCSEKERVRMIMEKKKAVSPAELCLGLPPEFAEYMRYVKSLKFRQNPDYEMLRSLFCRIARREGFQYDKVFDWTERLYLQSESMRIAGRSDTK